MWKTMLAERMPGVLPPLGLCRMIRSLSRMPQTLTDDARRLAWERRAEWPLTVLAVVFLCVYAGPILVPGIPSQVRRGCDFVGWAIWFIFAVDYLARLVLASPRGRFVRQNLLDLATVLLPMLRPLRVLRVVRVMRALDRRAAAGLRGRVALYVASAVSLVVFVASLAVLAAERQHPKANITTFGDAVWWALSTITTVGYGDRFPVTGEGRLVAVGLMLAGIALIGVVTAAVASWFVQRVTEVQQEEAMTRIELDEVLQEVRALRSELKEHRGENA